jgi:hypothetical protein
METPLFKEKKWAHYDVTNFPEVKVTLGKKISNEADFQNFLDEWEALYQRDRDFTIHFNTNEVGWISMKYCFKMRNFIRKIKEKYPRNLEKSYIQTNSKWVRFLLKTIFFLEKPVAPVYVYSGDFSDLENTTVYNP